MPDPQKFVAGSSSLVLGCDSYTSPAELGDMEYVFGQNVVCRGGIVQTRPGSASLYCAPDGNFQGFKVFTPQNGVAHHVFAVEGKVYVSPAPFTSYRRLRNIQFSNTSKYIAWAICLKSTDYDNEGNVITLDNPYSVLVMQDGLTRAAYWDGSNSAHLNPGAPPYPDQTDIAPGFTETPIGLWSIWAGNRLWVSRENQIFASDHGNPLKFTEATYLNEARAFYLSGPCTGMIATPDQQGIIAFTDTNGSFIQSSIEDRTQWLNTPDFIKVIIPTVGCVAPRSLLTQYGLTWWFGSRGLTNINAALRQNVTSRIDYADNEMFASKAYLGPDLSGICGEFYENYLMMSTPSGDVRNRHTWVLDQAPFEENANAWTGIWTGWRPIEWSRGLVNGNERVFFGSIDYDGKNRIWEAMLPERTDNGCRMTCYAQLRDHVGVPPNLDPKKYDWSKFFLSQIYGEVDLNVYVASTKGSFQLQKGYHIVASKGQIFSDVLYSEAGPLLTSNRSQTRVIRTPGELEDNECNACGVESKEGNLIDYAFTHLLVWSGQMGLRAYQMHMHEMPNRDAGDCEEDEVAPRTLNAQGCSGLELLVQGEVFETFTATKEGTTTMPDGSTVYIQQTAVSVISQRNADAQAECKVDQVINRLINLSNAGLTLAPGNYDGVIVSGLPVPDSPILESSAFESAEGTASLCGISEYTSPSTPPRKYRVQTAAGSLGGCFWSGDDCTGIVASQRINYSGTYVFDANTCAVTNTQNSEQFDTGGYQAPPCQGPAMVFTGNFVVGLGDTPSSYVGFPSGFNFLQTPTTRTWTGLNTCINPGGFNGLFSTSRSLSVEDTEDDAIARSTPSGTGTSAQAYRETRGAGDFTFLWQDSTLVASASSLIVGHTYKITLDLLTEDYGGGSPVNSQLVYNFLAVSASQVVNVPIPCPPGKQVTASNPAIGVA